MKKIIFLLLLFVNFGYSQITCTQTFTTTGSDASGVSLTITPDQLTCYSGDIESIKIKSASYYNGNTNDSFCASSGTWFYVQMSLNGEAPVNGCPLAITDLDITDFTSLTLTALDTDSYSDSLSFIIIIEVIYNTTETPTCNITLTSPIENSTTVELDKAISWTAATAATGYLINLGTTPGGHDILENLDVENVLTYQPTQNFLPGTTYYLSIISYNHNGISTDYCEEYTFTTCDSVTEFTENFNNPNSASFVDCWKKVTNNTYATATINNSQLRLYNAEGSSGHLGVISPFISNLTAGTHRLRFKASTSPTSSATNYKVKVGVVSDPSDMTSYQLVGEATVTNTLQDFFFNFDDIEDVNFIMISHGLVTTYSYIYVDDVVWEPKPAIIPLCIENLNIETNENCGNFATNISWENVEGADGYKVSIGNTASEFDIFSDINIGSNLNYSFTGAFNSTYFIKVVPFNIIGEAISCTTESFTTYEDGCHCISNPSSLDREGITSINFTDLEFSDLEGITYINQTEADIISFNRSTNASIAITFETYYSYDANIWIDFNNDYVFTADEKVFTGVTPEYYDGSHIMTANFTIAENAPLGNHRMRIGTADSGQATPNPCYNGTYGVTADFTINIEEAPQCLPITATTIDNITTTTATIHWTEIDVNTTYTIEYGEGNYTLGSGEIISQINNETFTFTDLTPNTKYKYYITTNCTESDSPVAGPFYFNTKCDVTGSFTENFNTSNPETLLPECWSKIVNSTSINSYVKISTWDNYIDMYNATDTAAKLYLISPPLEDMPLGTHRLKFTVSGSSTTSILVGRMTDPTDETTFEQIQSIPVTWTTTEKSVEFDTESEAQYFAIRFVPGSSTYAYVYIDNVVWEAMPTSSPECIDNVNVLINESCGNYKTRFTYNAVEGAEGYKGFVGTTSGVYDIYDGIDLGNFTEIIHEGDANTTYYIKFVPYNSFGEAIDCEEIVVTTSETTCHCPTEPSSVDNDSTGITSIIIDGTTYTTDKNSAPFYNDFKDQIIDIEAGSQMYFTFNLSTGYTYTMRMWIDYDNDIQFTNETEHVYSVVTSATNPTSSSGNITISDDPEHFGLRVLRVIGADSGIDTLQPNSACYSGTWGESADFTLNITPPLTVKDSTIKGLKVYPNPANSVVNINADSEIKLVNIYNLLGQNISSVELNNTINQIDISNLTQGTYLIKITTDSKSETVKLIKN